MKYLIRLSIVLLLSKTQISLAQSPSPLFHDQGIYTSFQFAKDENILITPQIWTYAKNIYFEARYNYEERKTFSLYIGRSFKTGKDSIFEIIPMFGGVIGEYTGISPALTCILKGKRLQGFSQSQYTIDLKGHNNFFFNWTAISVPIIKKNGLGIAYRMVSVQGTPTVYNYGPMINFQTGSFTFQGFAYNFWQTNSLWMIGLEYDL